MGSKKDKTSRDGPTRSGEFIGENLPRSEELRLIVDALNGKQLFYPGLREEFGDYDLMLREVPPILREIVGDWQSCERGDFKLSELFEKEPQMHREIALYWRTMPTTLVPAELGGGAADCTQPAART